eukprot:3716195-Amphidinium_carterae.1
MVVVDGCGRLSLPYGHFWVGLIGRGVFCEMACPRDLETPSFLKTLEALDSNAFHAEHAVSRRGVMDQTLCPRRSHASAVTESKPKRAAILAIALARGTPKGV